MQRTKCLFSAPAANEKRITKNKKNKNIPESAVFEPDQRMKMFFLLEIT